MRSHAGLQSVSPRFSLRWNYCSRIRLVAALDTKKEKKEDYFYTLDSVQMIWMIDKKSYNIRLILAILNSEFMNLYIQHCFLIKNYSQKSKKYF